MKAKQIFKAAVAAAVLTFVGAQTVSAKSWRVNNNSTKKANFVDINAAMASADVVAGDTLYLDPGCVLASEQTISKAVTVIGTGYFLQNGMVAATINNRVRIKAEGTKLNGVYVNGEVWIEANNITLERCKINHWVYSYNGTRYGLTVLQCFINNPNYENSINGEFRNATIKNNIIISSHAGYGAYSTAINNVHDSEIANNYLAVNNTRYNREVLYNVTNSQIYNNIIRHAKDPNLIFANSGAANNNSIYNNVITAADSTYTNVKDIVYLGSADMSSVFAPGISDAAYRLKEDSPAKGAGFGGADCGPYGGATPYVESGLPLYHPYIKKAIVAGKSVNGVVDVELNIKMQNE